MSELVHIPGIDYIGPLPADVQCITVFSCGLQTGAPQPDAAKALVAFLTTPAAAPLCKSMDWSLRDRAVPGFSAG